MKRCSLCKQELSAEFLAERMARRSRNVRAGLAASKKKIGRPRERDDLAIHRLRAQGMSMQAIAEKLKISIGTVFESLKAAT